jgi:aspartate/methionine/tyrosine aminotransferase
VPRFPDISAAAGAMPSSIFARLVEKLPPGEFFAFHLGDTHLLPPEPSRFQALAWDDKMYGYGAPAGDPALLDAIVRKLAERNAIPATRDNVQITAGATHAFACATRAVLEPHDEVLLLAPYWPLLRGHVLSVGARPVEVPFSIPLLEKPGADLRTLLDEYISPKTAAIYLTTPNNPDGKVLSRAQLEVIADVARADDLWVLSDEVYEDFTFGGRPHVSIASLPGMAERTITAFSFSKSYGQAGLRVGYAVGPTAAIVPIRKLANHTIYSVPRAMQGAALAALQGGAAFLAGARGEYERARDLTMATLGKVGVRCFEPEGGSYVFCDFTRWADGADCCISVLQKLAAAGILMAPGEAFGRAFGMWARLCYTAVPRERLEAGLAALTRVLG